MSLEKYTTEEHTPRSAQSSPSTMNKFRTKFWQTAAAVFMLATQEKLREGEVFDSIDTESALVQTMSVEEQASINYARVYTNENVHETAPIEFTTVGVNKGVNEVAA